MKKLIYSVLFVAVLILAISFAAKNSSQVVEVVYYFDFTWKGPLSVLLFSVLAIGALLGMLLTASWAWKAKRQSATTRRKMNRMEQEIASLRALPVKD